MIWKVPTQTDTSSVVELLETIRNSEFGGSSEKAATIQGKN